MKPRKMKIWPYSDSSTAMLSREIREWMLF